MLIASRIHSGVKILALVRKTTALHHPAGTSTFD
jgi:hypothetical protein